MRLVGANRGIHEGDNTISNLASKAREQESTMKELEQGQVEAVGSIQEFPPIWNQTGGVNVRMSEHCLNQQLNQIVGRQVEKVDVPERRIFKELKRILGLNL